MPSATSEILSAVSWHFVKLLSFTIVSLLSLFSSSALASRIERVFISELCNPYKSQLIFTIVIVETDAIIVQVCSLCVLAAANLERNQFEECFLSLHAVKCTDCLYYTNKLCVFPGMTL